MSGRFRSLVLAFLLLLPAAAGNAQEIAAVFATGEWPPYTSAKLPGYGYATRIVSAACEAGGIKPEYRFYPWPRAEQMVTEGRAFAAFPYIVNAEKRDKYLISDVVLYGTNYFVYYAKNPRTPGPFRYDSLEDFRGYTVGLIRGDSFEKEFQQAGIDIESSNLVDNSIKMLALGRIDFYLGEKLSIHDMVERLFPQEKNRFRLLPQNYGETRPNALIVSKAYPDAEEILRKFNQGLRHIKKNGTYDKIMGGDAVSK